MHTIQGYILLHSRQTFTINENINIINALYRKHLKDNSRTLPLDPPRLVHRFPGSCDLSREPIPELDDPGAGCPRSPPRKARSGAKQITEFRSITITIYISNIFNYNGGVVNFNSACVGCNVFHAFTNISG